MITVEYLDKLNKSTELQALEWDKCKNDPYYWMTTWARTINTHYTEWEDPNKTFPDKEYLRIIVDKFINSKILFIPKTRQMMLSWAMIALFLHEVQFHEAKMVAFQSKDKDSADYLIKRLKTIWDNEPEFLKKYHKNWEVIKLIPNPQNKWLHTYCKFDLPMIDSMIIWVAQGGDVLRMHTFSWVFSDEAAFQPEMKSAYTGLKPTLSWWWRLVCVSTAEGNTWFDDAITDSLIM